LIGFFHYVESYAKLKLGIMFETLQTLIQVGDYVGSSTNFNLGLVIMFEALQTLTGVYDYLGNIINLKLGLMIMFEPLQTLIGIVIMLEVL